MESGGALRRWDRRGKDGPKTPRRAPHAASLRAAAPEYRSAAHPALADYQGKEWNWTRVPAPPGGARRLLFRSGAPRAKKVLPPVGQQRARGQRGLPDTLIRARAGTHHRSPRTTPPARLASSSGMSCSWSPSQPGHVEPRHPGSPETAQRTEEKVAEGRHKRAQAAASSRDAKF